MTAPPRTNRWRWSFPATGPIPDRGVFAIAMLVVSGCVAGVNAPGLLAPVGWRWAALCLVLLGTAAAHRVLFVLGLVLCAVSHGAIGASTLYRSSSPAGSYAGEVTVRGDPIERRYGFELIAEVEGVRAVLSVPRDVGPPSVDVSELMVGDKVWMSGRLGPIRARTRWHDRHHLQAKGAVNVLRGARPAAGLWGAVNAPRRWLTEGTANLPTPRRSLILAMTIGDDRQIDAAQNDRFRRSGLMHLTVISGQNLSLTLALLTPLLALGGFRARSAAVIAVALAYVLLARADPSVCRAAGTACVLGISTWRGVRTSGIRALSAAVIVTCLVEPFIVFSVGFWLSCLASLGLLTLTPVFVAAIERAPRATIELLGRIRVGGTPGAPGPRTQGVGLIDAMHLPGVWALSKLGRLVAEAVAATCAAQVAVAPVIFLIGGPIPLSSVVANVLVVPAVTMITAGGIVCAVLWGAMGAAGAGWALVALGQLAGAVDAIATVGADHPLVLFDWWSLPAAVVGIWALWTWYRQSGRPGHRLDARLAGAAVAGLAVLGAAGFAAATPFDLGSGETYRRCALRSGVLVVDGQQGAETILADWYRSRLVGTRAVVVRGSAAQSWAPASQVARARPDVEVVAANSWIRTGTPRGPGSSSSVERLPTGVVLVEGVPVEIAEGAANVAATAC